MTLRISLRYTSRPKGQPNPAGPPVRGSRNLLSACWTDCVTTAALAPRNRAIRAVTVTVRYCGAATTMRVHTMRRRSRYRWTAAISPADGTGFGVAAWGTISTVTAPGARRHGYAASKAAQAWARATQVPGTARAMRSISSRLTARVGAARARTAAGSTWSSVEA